jgi:hypothetical protein
MTTMNKYTLEEINAIIFNGFDYQLSEEIVKKISDLASQVGSPTYVKTPIFQKRTNTTQSYGKTTMKSRQDSKGNEILDEQWKNIKKTPIAETSEKNIIDVQIIAIRTYLNKLTDKNYTDISQKIFEIIDKLIEADVTHEDRSKLISIIFDIASTNRFYSKMYADLCSELSIKYDIMRSIICNNVGSFTELFHKVEYINPAENYDKFCEINKTNEKRKSLALFYLNLMRNGIINKQLIIDITVNLLTQINSFISQEDKKNEVDELTETISILYDKNLYQDNFVKINDCPVNELVQTIANSKVKNYKSLTSKSLFKFMDLVEV